MTGRVSWGLGVVGGALGIILSQSLSFQGRDFVALSCGCGALQNLEYALLPAIVGGFLGLVGGLVSIVREKEGGVILFVGAGIATVGWFLALAVIAVSGSAMAFEIAFAYMLIDLVWWDSLVLLGALLVFPTTRRIMGQLHEGGWIP